MKTPGLVHATMVRGLLLILPLFVGAVLLAHWFFPKQTMGSKAGPLLAQMVQALGEKGEWGSLAGSLEASVGPEHLIQGLRVLSPDGTDLLRVGSFAGGGEHWKQELAHGWVLEGVERKRYPPIFAWGLLFGGLFVGSGAILWLLLRGLARSWKRFHDFLLGGGFEEGEALPPFPVREFEDLGRGVRGLVAHFSERARTSQANFMALEMAFEKIRSVLQSLGEGVVVADSGGDLVLANPVAQEVLGFSDSGWKGARLGELFPQRIRPRIDAAVKTAYRTRRTVILESLVFSGAIFNLSIAPILMGGHRSQGELQGVAIVFVDMTSVFELNRMKEDFLSSVSHELRTPLTSIRSYSEILLHMAPEDEDTRVEFLGVVISECERLARLVDDILDLARIEAGEMVLRTDALDSTVMLRGVSQVFQPLLQERGAKIQLEIEEDLAPIHADRDRLHQVLTNLIGNAVKFLPPVDGLVRVSAREEGESILFCIEDNGPGIPESEWELIFEKFKQVGDTLTEKPKGTGLGLPICREIIMQHGGRIWCERSEDLGGACFYFGLSKSKERVAHW
jgi:signal transduction histidine kinase